MAAITLCLMGRSVVSECGIYWSSPLAYGRTVMMLRLIRINSGSADLHYAGHLIIVHY